MNTTQRFEEFLGTACEPGKLWGRRQLQQGKTPREIWEACQDGAWMAYWLTQNGVTYSELQRLRNNNGWAGNVFGANLPNAAQFADTLRATFTMTGKRRKQR